MPSDATGDADGDGVQNKDEYLRGSHPRGTHTRYFAEGSANRFFETTLALLNPGDDAARVVLRFLRSDGAPVSHTRVIAAHSRATIVPADIMGAADFSTIVESDRVIVADRTMTWAGEARYGSHAEGSLASPGLTWYLAEGATHGAFDLYYLLQNPNDDDAQVRVRYLLPEALPPIEKTYTVAAREPADDLGGRRDVRGGAWRGAGEAGRWRRDADAAGGDEFRGDRGDEQSADRRRARDVHDSRPARPSARATAARACRRRRTRWFLAEGATGPFFDMFVLLANPRVGGAGRITYLLRRRHAHAHARRGGEQPRHHLGRRRRVRRRARERGRSRARRCRRWSSRPTACRSSSNDRCGGRHSARPDGWVEAHNSPGTTQTGIEWALAGGELGGRAGTETFILIANTSTFAGTARVRLMFENGETMDHDVTLPANSRTTVSVRDAFPLAEARRFGALITSTAAGARTPAQLVVERAMYANANGVTWGTGTNLLGTKLH